MDIIVQKYGGKSVADKEKLKCISERIISYVENSNKVVVVVSAQGSTTDDLINSALEYSREPNKRDLDMLLSTGEMKTVSYLSMLLNDMGYNTIGLTGEQAGILSTSDYGSAKIHCVYTDNILNYLQQNYIVIVARISSCR